MKSKLVLCTVLKCACLLCGCGNAGKELQRPEEAQIKAICELSTLECKYHNVAKGDKTKGEGLSHFGEKDRKYWIEYEGVVKLGVDMSKVTMEIDGTDVIITMPQAEIQSMDIVESSFNEYSVISSEDAFFNKNKITVEDQKEIVAEAQDEMKTKVLENTDLLNQARDRVKTLITNYVDNLGQATGVEYHVIWEEAK